MSFTLEDKQQYYRYPESGWTYKKPPTLRDDVKAALERGGLADRYRFTWMGVDIIRSKPYDENPIVRGDRNATRLFTRQVGYERQNGVMRPIVIDHLEPKKLFVHTRQPKGLYYHDASNCKVHVTRPELVPDGYIIEIEYEYHMLGALEWRIEQRLTPEQRAANPWGEEWMSVQTIKGKNGGYQEPTVLHVLDLRKRNGEDRNLTKKEVREVAEADAANRDQDKRIEAFCEEVDERAAVSAGVHEVLSHYERLPHSA